MVTGPSHTILVVVGTATAFGGVPHWLSYLIPGLQDRGWRVVMGLASGPQHHNPTSFFEELPFTTKRTLLHTRSCTPESRAKAVAKAVLKTNPDVVLGINIADTYEGCRRARQQGWAGRSVQTLHGIEPDYYDDLRVLSPHLDALVCTNRLSCRLAEEWSRFPSERIYYAPYGVELPVFKNASIENGTLTLAYSGRLEQPQKRVHDLPALLAALRQKGVVSQLLIAGSGPEEESLRKECAGYNVTFLGRLPPEELSAKLYGRADILVIPSSWETGPIVAWEAMAAGAIVVSSRYVGHRLENALRDGENCRLFNTGDTETAARIITELYGDTSQMTRLQDGGRRLVEDRYSRQHSISEWDSVLHAIAGKAPLPPCSERITDRSTSRLDNWFGPPVAEFVRAYFKRSYAASGPGDEWPHAYGEKDTDSKAFMEQARDLDAQIPLREGCDA